MKKTVTLLLVVCCACVQLMAQLTPSSEWVWLKGNSTFTYVAPVYGTQGVEASTNDPGSLGGAANWKDGEGNLWVFGGAFNPLTNLSNALWKYNAATNNWVWFGGSSSENQPGVYGTKGVASATNQPGARESAASWTGADGKFWLFGGIGKDANGALGRLNDLWMYDPATNMWTWVSGSNTINAIESGSVGVPNPANTPAARYGAAAAVDSNGDLLLFGGNATNTSTPTEGVASNDFWKYDVSENVWIKIQNYSITVANNPGPREYTTGWTDHVGNFWVFGGNGRSVANISTAGLLNDLWKYNLTTGVWTYIKGGVNQAAEYGAKGVPTNTTIPGSRFKSAGATDSEGNLLLFAGSGAATSNTVGGLLNDLWRFNVTTNQWVWLKGDNVLNSLGKYGTKGVPAADNNPNARARSHIWVDKSGNVFVFGGDSRNDLWKLINSTPPPPTATLTCPSSISVATANGTCTAVINNIDPQVSPSGSTVNYTLSGASTGSGTGSVSGKTFNKGVTTVTYTLSSDETKTCSFTVTVTDGQAPAFTAPANRNVNLTENCQLIVPDLISGLTGTDNCGVVTFTQMPAAGAVINAAHGTTVPVTITANDGNGNTTDKLVSLTAVDNIPPVVSGCPSTITVTSCTPTKVTWVEPTATDNCSAPISTTFNYAPGAEFPVGTTTVTYVFEDAAGNKTTCSFNIVVTAATGNPVISGCPATISKSSCGPVAVSWAEPTAVDNCGNIIPYSTRSHAPGAVFPIGTTVVKYTFKDASGNTSTCQFSVAVKAVTGNPVVSACPGNISKTSCGAMAVSWSEPTAVDNCGNALSYFTRTHKPGSVFPIGATTVKYTFKDAAGKISTCQFTVTIKSASTAVIKCAVPAVFCYKEDGMYTIPNIDISGTCIDVKSVSYEVTGATSRKGMGLNASGSFNPGVSYINWVVEMNSGEKKTCRSTVTVNHALVAYVPPAKALAQGVDDNTVYIGYTPASFITLSPVVSGGSGSYKYKWSTGATSKTLKVSPKVATTYTFTVIDSKGCVQTSSITITVKDVRCGSKLDKVEICHTGSDKKDKSNAICVSSNAVAAQLANGSYLGACATEKDKNKNKDESDKKGSNERRFVTESNEYVGHGLTAKVINNPTYNYFTIVTKSEKATPLNIRVSDRNGAVIEMQNNVPANKTIQVGHKWRPGMYMIEIVQAREKVVLKLIKH